MALASVHAPIGDNLARIRRRRHLTQEGLAEQAGVSVDLIKKLEQHRRESARLNTLECLARTLDVEVSELTTTSARIVESVEVSTSQRRPSGATIEYHERR